MLNSVTSITVLLVLCRMPKDTVSARPNIVFILTDDQDVSPYGMYPMKKTRTLVAEQGITFTNAFATTPICCPSRSSILTGLYLHSHGTVNNTIAGGCSNARWQREQEPNTFGAQLHRHGYKTFYAGKYLNQYGHKGSGHVKHIPEGWDWWVGLVGNSVYYNYTLSVNGSRVVRGDEESDYLTDVLKGYSLKFLNEHHGKPFLMVVSPPAPHEPFTPAKRHVGRFKGYIAPRTPNFNFPINSTKHWLLRLPPHVLPPQTIRKIDQVFRNRWESLLAVDELIEAIVYKLEQLRFLDNTFIIFTSDHGFHLGQFAQPWDKRQPYETDIRVPLLLRGPGLSKKLIKHTVLNIDIAPTIMDMGEVPIGHHMDGKSFLPLIRTKSKKESRSFLIEYKGEGGHDKKNCYDDPNVKLCYPETSCKCFDSRNNTFTCLRHQSERTDHIFCRFRDEESFQEFYDLKKDPYQLTNLGASQKTEIYGRMLECAERNIELNESVSPCLRAPDQKTEFPAPELIQIAQDPRMPRMDEKAITNESGQITEVLKFQVRQQV